MSKPQQLYAVFDGEQIWAETVRGSRHFAILSFLRSMGIILSTEEMEGIDNTWKNHYAHGFRTVKLRVEIVQ